MSRKTYTLTLTEQQMRHLEEAMYCIGNEDMEPKETAIHMRLWAKIVEARS